MNDTDFKGHPLTFGFFDAHMPPKEKGVKLAIFKIQAGEDETMQLGFTEWDGEVYGLPAPPEGSTIVLLFWAECDLDAMLPQKEKAKIITLN